MARYLYKFPMYVVEEPDGGYQVLHLLAGGLPAMCLVVLSDEDLADRHAEEYGGEPVPVESADALADIVDACPEAVTHVAVDIQGTYPIYHRDSFAKDMRLEL